MTVHHVGIGESPLGDQANSIRDIGVGGTGPLAIHDLVKVVGMRKCLWGAFSAAAVRRTSMAVNVCKYSVALGIVTVGPPHLVHCTIVSSPVYLTSPCPIPYRLIEASQPLARAARGVRRRRGLRAARSNTCASIAVCGE